MPKGFSDIAFDKRIFEQDVTAFESLLATTWLSERDELLPFFREHPVLSSRIASVIQEGLLFPDRMAFEFDIFGDFVADLVVGSSVTNTYCFVEFEDAQEYSLFRKRGNRFEPSFGARFEHGYSQIVDWFCALEGMKGSGTAYLSRFGSRDIHYQGLLVIGRDASLDADPRKDALRHRIEWRSRNVRFSQRRIVIMTYDELLGNLRYQDRMIENFRD